MSAVRVTVEHSYMCRNQYWTSQDFACMLKVRNAPIAPLYLTSCLLLNIWISLYEGWQVQHQYQIHAPTAVKYLVLNEEE